MWSVGVRGGLICADLVRCWGPPKGWHGYAADTQPGIPEIAVSTGRLAATPQIINGRADRVDVGLYLGIGVEVVLDVAADLFVRLAAQAGEEIVDVRVGKQIIRHHGTDLTGRLGQIRGRATWRGRCRGW